MKYSEFKEKIENWGEKYGYETEVVFGDFYTNVEVGIDEAYYVAAHISNINMFDLETRWDYSIKIKNHTKGELFDILIDFVKTPIKEREDMIIYSEEHKNKEDIKMDRDIKFRAWHKATKNMYEVAQIDFYNERVGYLFTDPISQSEVIGYVNFSDIELMQFTGFKDDNGVEIYEGDIVEIYMDNGYEYGGSGGVVEFTDGCYLVNNTLLTDSLDDIQVVVFTNKYFPYNANNNL